MDLTAIKDIPGGFLPPVWLISIAFSFKLFGLEKAVQTLYNDIFRDWLATWFKGIERGGRSLSDRATADIVYAHYMAIARHVITTAWWLKQRYNANKIADSELYAQLRTHSSDAVKNARIGLSHYANHRSGASLDAHLSTLSNDSKTEFFGVVVSEILNPAPEFYAYEALRFRVLERVDTLINEAVTQITTHNG